MDTLQEKTATRIGASTILSGSVCMLAGAAVMGASGTDLDRALFTGILNTVAQYAGGLTTYGFLVIPVGMGWMIAAAVVLWRRR